MLNKRLDRLEAEMLPPPTDDIVLLLISVPAVNGKVCPDFAARGVQRAQCGDRSFTRAINETEAAFKSRVVAAVKIPGGAVTVILR